MPYVQPSAATSKNARQVIADQSEVAKAEGRCQLLSGNDVISCYPEAGTVIAQHEWATFVWNSRLPGYQYTDLVNIYLFRADSRLQVLQMMNVTNPFGQAGSVPAQVNDSWWGSNGSNWNGKNISYPFYWLISPSNQALDGSQTRQQVFSAVQTTYADSVLASIMSSSSLAAAASAASASSASLSSYLSSLSSASAASATHTGGTGGTGSLQNNGSSSSFPHWAIAVIVVLGFLAIAATCVLVFLILRRIHRKQVEYNRNSMGSASPMMRDVQQQSPLTANAPQSSIGHQPFPGSVIHDGASTISRPGSATEAGPFSPADAAIMADAYRKMLRRPDFAERVEEDAEPEVREDLITRELAEEGRDIRSVSSSRGVRVETLSDNGDTVQDHSRLRD